MATNGSLLVFTDMAILTAYSDLASDFDSRYYKMYAVLARSFNYLLNNLLHSQKYISI